MSRWYELHIKNEILFWFLIVSIFPILTLFGINYTLQQNQFKSQAQTNLKLVLDEKISKIETQIDSFKKELNLLSGMPSVVENFKACNKSFQTHRHVIADKKLDRLLKDILNKNRLHDIFFINLDGDIIYTLAKESDLGTNLLSGPYKESNLATMYKNTTMFLEARMSEFEFYLPSNKHAAFMAHPIYSSEDKIIGVIAVQFNQKMIFDIFSDHSGLGKSGELFASYKNNQNKIISVTPLRHFKDSVKNEYEFGNKEYLPTVKAAVGLHGSGETLDYRGVEVVAAWDYIPVLNWGVVAKMDKDEILKPIYDMEFYSIIVMFFVLLAIVVAIVMATKHIVTPIDNLTQKVRRFSNGSFDKAKFCELDSVSDNEIGTLARNFNEMAANLMNSQDTIKKYARELEEKVKLRTKELETTKDELVDSNLTMKRYLDIVDKYVIISSTDLKGKITSVSSAFCEITGYTKEELLGKHHNIIRHPSMPSELYKQMWKTIKNDQVWSGEIQNLKKDGSFYWVYSTISPVFDHDSNKIGYTSIRQDISDKKQIELISITDGLTNIYNRRHFNELFPKIINSAKRKNEFVAFLIMDIDHFKQYNDTYGHQMGDEVLIKVAAAIKKSLQRADDYCFRLGGEEFGVIFKADSKEHAEQFANTIRENIENLHIEHSGNSAGSYVTASMGLICKNANDINNADEVYKQGDDLLYRSKESGRNRVSV